MAEFPTTISSRRRGSPAYAVALLLTVVSRVQGATIITPPSNVAGNYGENLTLRCTISGETGAVDPFEWVKLVGSDRTKIYSDFPNTINPDPNKYSVTGHDLTVRNVDSQDGARYACHLFLSDEKAAWLLSLKIPDVQMTGGAAPMDGQMAQAECAATMGADRDLYPDITPRVQMRLGNRDVATVQSVSDYAAGQPYMITGKSNFTVSATDDKQNVTCELSIEDPVWSTTGYAMLRVIYGARDVVFPPLAGEYPVGSHINCSAKGNPDPEYTWQAEESPAGAGTSLEGSILEITQAMVGENRWTCTANNRVNGEQVTAVREIYFQAIQGPDPPGTSTGAAEPWKIAVGVVVPIVLIAVICLIVFLVKRKEKGSGGSSAKPGPGGPTPAEKESTLGVYPGDVNMHPNPEKPNPVIMGTGMGEDRPRVKDSPGFADLGIRQISNMNVSQESLDVSMDRGRDNRLPLDTAAPPGGYGRHDPHGHFNPTYENPDSPGAGGVPNNQPPPQHQPQARGRNPYRLKQPSPSPDAYV